MTFPFIVIAHNYIVSPCILSLIRRFTYIHYYKRTARYLKPDGSGCCFWFINTEILPVYAYCSKTHHDALINWVQQSFLVSCCFNIFICNCSGRLKNKLEKVNIIRLHSYILTSQNLSQAFGVSGHHSGHSFAIALKWRFLEVEFAYSCSLVRSLAFDATPTS